MGPDEDAVVDPHLRVRGADRLWVADCSIMPTLVSGNTSVPAMMIAEKAADLIMRDCKQQIGGSETSQAEQSRTAISDALSPPV